MRELWPAFALAAATLLAGSLLVWLPGRRLRRWIATRRRPAPRPAPRVKLLLALAAAGLLLAACGLLLALAAASAGTYRRPAVYHEELVALVTAVPVKGRSPRMRLTYRPVERGLRGRALEFALAGEEWGVRGDALEWSLAMRALGFRPGARLTAVEGRRAGAHPRAQGRDVHIVGGGSDWLWHLAQRIEDEPMLATRRGAPALVRALDARGASARPRAGSLFRVFVGRVRVRKTESLVYRIEETRPGPDARGH